LALTSLSRAEMATRRWGTPPKSQPVKVRRAKPPTGYVPQSRSAPVIDGKLTDACWAKAYALSLARTLDGGGSASQPTEARLTRDNKNLFVAFRCKEPFLNKLKGSRRSHDGEFWNDDSVELFLGAASSGSYYHFGFTAFGSSYDGRVKDASWNSGMEVAVAKGKGEWMVESAIPLEKLVGKGKPPLRWIANFTRNRYTRGRWEEFAWSPTYSGNSHVPGRFGQLLFKEPPSEEREADKAAAQRVAPEVEFLSCRGGEGVVRFNLSGLKGAKIYRADLLIFRNAKLTGADEEAFVDIEIYPLFTPFAAGGKPEPRGRPLALRGPWYDRLDATDAVRAWARGKPNGGFFAKACPLWNAEATCLEVAYEGTPKKVPPQVTGLRVLHRSGQTFITWREIEDLVGRDTVKWGALRSILASMDREREVRYCVYQSERPITAATLPGAELIAAVKPLSCWNINGRNIDRPIDHVIATKEVLMTGQWNPFRSATIDGDYGRDCQIERLVVSEGGPPLPRGTGLYVHTATRKAKPCYAVVTSVDGVQNTTDIGRENSTVAPIQETPAEAQPVLQRELPKMPFFNYSERRLHYVRWVAPPYVNLPCQYYNWSVGIPEKMGRRVPLELSLHRDGHSYWRTQYRIERDSIVLSPHDFPTKSWWYGYHESCGTLRSFKQGCIQAYTERRLLSFVEWACKKWPVDRSRILVTGCRGGAAGSGALHVGIRHPDVFNLVIAGHPVVDYASASRRTDRWGLPAALSMQAVWGKADWDIKTDDGKSFWEQHNMLKVVRSLPPAAELPYMTITSSHGYAQCRKLYELMLTRHAGLMAEFSWGGARYVPVSNTGTYPNVIRLDIRKNEAFLAFTSAQGLKFVTEGKMGDFNRHFRWRDIVDEADRFKATLFLRGRGDGVADIAPRRLQRFKVPKGRTYAWKNIGLDSKTEIQRGDATVGKDGLLVLRGVKFVAEGSRLVITPK